MTEHKFCLKMACVLFCVLSFSVVIFGEKSSWAGGHVFAQGLPDSKLPSSFRSPKIILQDMVLIPEGVFTIGAKPEVGYEMCKKYIDKLGIGNFGGKKNTPCNNIPYLREAPSHKVYLDAFYIDKYEVTQEKYAEAMKKNPSKFKGPSLPVDSVNWSQANLYCKEVGKRLPTEAEWEKAAKGGKETVFPWGNNMEKGKANFCDQHCEYEWKSFKLDDGYKYTAPVGSYPPNGYGLFDMIGNVLEWVEDWMDHGYYGKSTGENPQGPRRGTFKVLRGGSWFDHPTHVRTAWRDEYNPKVGGSAAGFRCALSVL